MPKTRGMGKLNQNVTPWDGTTKVKFPTTAAMAQAASGNNLLAAAGVGLKYRIFLLTVSADTAGLITVSDFTNCKHYFAANGSITWDFGSAGILQGTANTAITITNAGGGNFGANVLYSVE